MKVLVSLALVASMSGSSADQIVAWEVSFRPNSLDSGTWANRGSLGRSVSIESPTGDYVDRSFGNEAALCFASESTALTYIDYDTNAAIRPELSMEIWVKPTQAQSGNDWLLGHDNGGYDRSIIAYDSRYGGIAAGIGGTYASTLGYPELNQWTQIVVTFSTASGQATIYKNGGDLTAGGSQQTESIKGVSGGESSVGLNGLKNYANHAFVGCIGRINMVDQVISAETVAELFRRRQPRFSSPEWEVSFTPASLQSQGEWLNEGSLGSDADLSTYTGDFTESAFGNNPALCFASESTALSFIEYDTNSAVRPELTMEIWVKPTETQGGKDWLLGHDNGGYDRSIIAFDSRYGGIAAGIGGTYASTIEYPAVGAWTQIVVTFSTENGEAVIYKNGGSGSAGGEQQTEAIKGVSGGESNIGLNGLKNYASHAFVGCIGKVQLTSRVLSAEEVASLYESGQSDISSTFPFSPMLLGEPMKYLAMLAAVVVLFVSVMWLVIRAVGYECSCRKRNPKYAKVMMVASSDDEQINLKEIV